MKSIQIILTSLMAILGLFSCGTNNKQENIPNMDLAKEFGIDSTQSVYQYYQKFGFTDVCEDLRIVSRQSDSPNLEKELPIETEDLKTINAFSNKTDKIVGSIISFETNTRREFYDIELEFMEFSSDSMITLQLKKGEYEILQSDLISTLKIYDSESRLLYVETHRCDGK